jgi:hypothetical protein
MIICLEEAQSCKRNITDAFVIAIRFTRLLSSRVDYNQHANSPHFMIVYSDSSIMNLTTTTGSTVEVIIRS